MSEVFDPSKGSLTEVTRYQYANTLFYNCTAYHYWLLEAVRTYLTCKYVDMAGLKCAQDRICEVAKLALLEGGYVVPCYRWDRELQSWGTRFLGSLPVFLVKHTLFNSSPDYPA